MAELGNNEAPSTRTTKVVVRAGTALSVIGGSLVAVASPSVAAPAPATTHTVTSTGDAGAGTLREALDGAVDGDIITFDLELPATIEVATDLVVSDLVTITGPGADDLTIDAGSDTPGNRAFYLYPDTPGAISISGLTVTGGNVEGNGGGIGSHPAAGVDLTLTDVVVDGNTATGPGDQSQVGNGGGIELRSGSLTLVDSTVSGNTARRGGGIMVDGRESGPGLVSLSGSTIEGNEATASFNEQQQQAKYPSGGGVLVWGGDGAVQITDTVFVGNVAQSGKYGGLGVVGHDDAVTITGSTFGGDTPEVDGPDTGDANVALVGGGIGLRGIAGGATITDTTISGNVSFFGGGLKYLGVDVFGGGPQNARIEADLVGPSLLVQQSSLSGNVAVIGGGAAVTYGQAAFVDTTVSDNQFKYGGGGLSALYADVVVDRTTISGNVAAPQSDNQMYGAGMLVKYGSTVDVVNSTVSENVVPGLGGGIAVVNNGGPQTTTLRVRNSTIAANTAEDGGGIFVEPSEQNGPDQPPPGAAFAVVQPDEEAPAPPVTIENTILGDNIATEGTSNDVAGTIGARASLVEDTDSDLDDPGTAVVVDQGDNVFEQDPRLSALRNNGGPTETQAPQIGSPAVNAGDSTDAPPTDQRGFARVVGSRIDMGAVELQPTGGGGAPAQDEPPCAGAPAGGFSDVGANNVHQAAVDCLKFMGVAQGGPEGMPADQYGPGLGVTRGQMASFLARLIREAGATLPANPSDAFGDDDGTEHEANINALAAVDIVNGYEDGTYREGDPVRRDQMASFLLRTHEYIGNQTLPPGADAFDDDEPGNVHEAAINALAAAGVIEGTATPRQYDPDGTVRRDQMASFLIRLANLLASQDDFPVNP